MYINSSKTKMYCILVFLNYHSASSFWLCAATLSLWASSQSKCKLPCDYTCVLAESHSTCPLSSYIATSSYLIQAFPWTSPSYSHTRMTGSSLFHKVTNYSYMSRIPQSHSMPKSGNVCGRRYTKTKIPSWHPHHLTSFALPSFSGPISNPIHSWLEESKTSQSNTSRMPSGVIVLTQELKGITPTPVTTRRPISQLSSISITFVGLKYVGIDKRNTGTPFA